MTPPALTFSHNIPYLLYLHMMQWAIGPRALTIIIANSVLMLLLSVGVFRVGWKMVNPRYHFLGAIASLLFFQVNPLVILLPLALGYLGGALLAPLLLLLFLAALLAIEHWSAFMRAIVLALLWSLFLWVHLSTAALLAAVMVPWMLYSRRPLVAMGIFLTMVGLGTLVFASVWLFGCALLQHWILVKGPVQAAQELLNYVQDGLSVTWAAGGPAMGERFLRVIGWVSPFFLLLGLWSVAKTLRRMLRDRRSSIADLAALASLAVLGVILVTGGKDTLPGAWYVLLLVALWSPLVARDLAQKENFYSRCFRSTALIAFGVCGVVLWVLQRDPSAELIPDPASLAKVLAAVAVAGGATHALFSKHPITLENRIRAVLAGATLAYGLVLDCFLFR